MLTIKDLIRPGRLSRKIANEAHKIFMHALRRRIKKVHSVRHLYSRDPKGKTTLDGLMWKGTIYIASRLGRDGRTTTMIHELIHFVFKLSGMKLDEKKTCKAEERLFNAFSWEQKDALWHFLPKKVTLENIDHENIP